MQYISEEEYNENFFALAARGLLAESYENSQCFLKASAVKAVVVVRSFKPMVDFRMILFIIINVVLPLFCSTNRPRMLVLTCVTSLVEGTKLPPVPY